MLRRLASQIGFRMKYTHIINFSLFFTYTDGWARTGSPMRAAAVPDAVRPDAAMAGNGSRTCLDRRQRVQAKHKFILYGINGIIYLHNVAIKFATN